MISLATRLLPRAAHSIHQVEQMDEAIRGAGPFLMVGQISPADILFASCLDWAMRYDIGLPVHLIDYRWPMRVRAFLSLATNVTERLGSWASTSCLRPETATWQQVPCPMTNGRGCAVHSVARVFWSNCVSPLQLPDRKR